MPLTIDNEPILDPNALKGLKNILRSDKLRRYHDGDANFTEKELGDILDLCSTQNNSIDKCDAALHRLRNTGLSGAQLTTLAMEYETRFPRGRKKIAASFWKSLGKASPITATLAKLNNSRVESLPSSREYRRARAAGVLQGEARYIDPNGVTGGLYTFGAISCGILIAMARNMKNGRFEKIGLAHIDRSVGDESIREFFERLAPRRDKIKIEVHVLSGSAPIASNILSVSREIGAEIVFFDADLDASRIDAAVVDSRGRIFYGPRTDFNASLFDQSEMDMLHKTRPGNRALNFR